MGEGAIALPPDGLPDGGQSPAGRKGGNDQADQARQARRARHDERHAADPRLDAHARRGQRADRVEEPQRAERDPRRSQCGRDDQHDPLEQRHPRDVPGARAARAQHGGLDPALVDQQPGHEDQRVGRQDDELDRQQQHAGAAHQQRPIRALQHLRQAGRHAEECAVAEVRADPALQGRRVAAQPAHVLERQVVEVRQRAPGHVEVAGRDSPHEVVAGDDQRPVDGERRTLADAGELQRVAEPIRLGRVVRLPDRHDPDLDDARLAGAARQSQLVTDGQAELLGGTGRHGGLERLGTRRRPCALDQGGVLHQPVGCLEDGDVGLGRIGDGAVQVVGARSDRPRQLATGPAQDPSRLAADRLVDRAELVRLDPHLDVDAGRRRRLRGERLPEAAERNRVAIQDADRQQRRGAHDHEPGGGDDQPVGEASLQDNAQRGQRALQHPDPPFEPTSPAEADQFTMLMTNASVRVDPVSRIQCEGR